MQELSKSVRRAIRELGSLAYERELTRALSLLFQQFQHWQAGGIDAFDLSQHVHEFHQGPARELFGRYADNSLLDLMVARAIVDGIIDENEIPANARDHLLQQAGRLRASRQTT